MRKIVSISVIILILFSGVTVNLVFHYCGGMLAEKKVSLTDIHGSCGMEGEPQLPVTGMKSLCCENSVSSYTFNNIFLPSPNVKDDASDHEIPVLEIFSVQAPDPASDSFSEAALARPPGPYSPSSVQIDRICIFRI